MPVGKAKVCFEIINYSEYTPIAAGLTDEKGTIELTTGLGSLHIFVKKGTLVGEGFMDTRKENSVFVTLKEDLAEEKWKTWDMFAPADAPVNRAAPSKEQAELGKQRLSLAVEKRKAKMADFKHPEREAFLLKDMEDNHSLRLALMNVLTEKDQTDCICQVLEEHLKYGTAYKNQYEEDIFVPYVLNPRVDHEVLTKYREDMFSKFYQIQQDIFQSTPKKIWEYIEDTIISCPDQERESLITTPSACLKLGVGSRLSKEILFVAIARTLGIPSRLNPSDRSMEYMKNGVFIPVLKEAVKNCRLVLIKEEEAMWKYFQNWSIARMSEDGFTSLKLEDRIWDKSRLSLNLEAGRYRILTSNRLPNSNIFAYQYDFILENGEEKAIKLLMRSANLSDMLENITIPESCLFSGPRKL